MAHSRAPNPGGLTNDHTPRAYERAVRHFLDWSEDERLELPCIMAGDVGPVLAASLPAEPPIRRERLPRYGDTFASWLSGTSVLSTRRLKLKLSATRPVSSIG